MLPVSWKKCNRIRENVHFRPIFSFFLDNVEKMDRNIFFFVAVVDPFYFIASNRILWDKVRI